MSFDLKIGLAQINPVVGDVAYNTKLIIDTALSTKGDILLFPELCVCGYPPEDLVLKPSFVESCMNKVQEIADTTKHIETAIVVGSPWKHENEGKLPYNATIFIYKGEILAVSYKYDLPNYGVFDEKRTFTAGKLPEPVKFKGKSIGLMICEDMWQPSVSKHLAEQGADILLVPNGSPFADKKHLTRIQLARKRVQETKLPLIYVNQIGGQDELVFDGGSFAMDISGSIICQLPFFEEASSLNTRSDNHLWDIEDRFEPMQFTLIYDALTLGLRDYVHKNGFSGVLIGLSGGVDSALTAVLAVEALGAENVHCVMLPSQFTSDESLRDARELADNLGVKLDTISIEEPLKAFENSVPDLNGLAHENIQSRIRGNILMALSNSTGKMLITTGNKSEMAVGYATIYGDMNGGFNALKDVYKTQVYDLCYWRNGQGHVIPENILTRAPSAELRDNQTDQDSLPSYDILDGILKGLVEDEKSLDDLVSDGYERETILKIWTLLDRNEYKRYQAPPGTKITSKAFGRDRRYPMTNGFVKNLKN